MGCLSQYHNSASLNFTIHLSAFIYISWEISDFSVAFFCSDHLPISIIFSHDLDFQNAFQQIFKELLV